MFLFQEGLIQLGTRYAHHSKMLLVTNLGYIL